MPELIKKTTREHYEKYSRLSDERCVKWGRDSAQRMLGISHEELVRCFTEDPVLNNIRLTTWDAMAQTMYPEQRRGLALSEIVCLQKHCAIYQCIGAKPEFEDSPQD